MPWDLKRAKLFSTASSSKVLHDQNIKNNIRILVMAKIVLSILPFD